MRTPFYVVLRWKHYGNKFGTETFETLEAALMYARSRSEDFTAYVYGDDNPMREIEIVNE